MPDRTVTINRLLPLGRPYQLPAQVRASLEQIFQRSVGTINLIEHSLYARAHLGMIATTRPSLILLAGSGDEFVANPEWLLHEYFHVVEQWATGRLTRWRYLKSSLGHGYRNNPFELEARHFATAMLHHYRPYLYNSNS